jgi:hypothetical protein
MALPFTLKSMLRRQKGRIMGEKSNKNNFHHAKIYYIFK